MMKRPTIYTVAEMANVSISTVSRIINRSFTGDEEVLNRVLDVIKTTNYVPKPEARRLMGKKIESRIIGVLAPFFIHPFFVEVLKGIYGDVHGRDYSIILYDVSTREKKKSIFRKVIAEEHVDGLLLVNMHLNQTEYQAIQEKTPLVLVAADAEFADYIMVDQYRGVVTGLEYVYSLGHRSVVFINNEKEIYETVVRESAFRDTAKKLGISCFIDYRAVDRRSGYFAAKAIIENHPETTCLFYYSDLMAYGGLDYVSERQLGEKISILGFDGFEMSFQMNLTTIVQPMETMGALGAQTLFNRIDDPTTRKQQIVLEPSLVKGKTCKAAKYE